MAHQAENSLPAGTGRHVDLEMVTEGGEVERLALDIVADEAADFERGMLGENTPLAKAISGATAGSVVPYRVGDVLEVRILAVTAELSGQPVDLTKRRQATERKAIRKADQTNLIIFASTVDSKWGDYDSGIIQDEDEEAEE